MLKAILEEHNIKKYEVIGNNVHMRYNSSSDIKNIAHLITKLNKEGFKLVLKHTV